METVRDLNMDADEMQVVLSAISSVSRRIKEVAQTHKPLFGGEHFLTGKEVCEGLYTAARTPPFPLGNAHRQIEACASVPLP